MSAYNVARILSRQAGAAKTDTVFREVSNLRVGDKTARSAGDVVVWLNGLGPGISTF